jgi:hypothetical protein
VYIAPASIAARSARGRLRGISIAPNMPSRPPGDQAEEIQPESGEVNGSKVLKPGLSPAV